LLDELEKEEFFKTGFVAGSFPVFRLSVYEHLFVNDLQLRCAFFA
jgi:hypothetical protein